MRNICDPYVRSLVLLNQKKSLDIFKIPEDEDHLLLVFTDRFVGNNFVCEDPISEKGYTSASLSFFWSCQIKDVPYCMVAKGRKIYRYLPSGEYPEDLHFRSFIVKKLRVIPVTFRFRSVFDEELESLWQKKVNPYGVRLGRKKRFQKFNNLVFTPMLFGSPASQSEVKRTYPDIVRKAKNICQSAKKIANSKGIDIFDMSLSFGTDKNGNLFVANDFLSLDSCRFAILTKNKNNPVFLGDDVFRAKLFEDQGKVLLNQKEVEYNDYDKLFLFFTKMLVCSYQEKYFSR